MGASEPKNEGMFISKNWVIGILTMIVAFLLAFGINDKVAAVADNTSGLAALRLEVTEMRGDLGYVKTAVDEIKAAVGVKKEVKP